MLGPIMTAMLTPFDAHGAVDYEEAGRLAEYLIDNGNDGIIVSGTTGESPALEDDEKLRLFEAVKSRIGDRGAVVAGTGGNNTHHSVDLSKRAAQVGVDAILAVVPYYNKPTQDGMMRHFGAIAEACDVPIIVYNIPSRTGANMLPSTLLALAERYPTIAGVKESSGDLAQMSIILSERADGFGFWCGDDHLFLPSLAIGGDGLISVAAHVCGHELREMYDAFIGGDTASAAQVHLRLSPLLATLFVTTNPIPVKWAMNELGFALGECRSPLGTMPEELKARLGPMLDAYRPLAPA